MTGTISNAEIEPVGQNSNSVGVTIVTWDSSFQDLDYASPDTIWMTLRWTVNTGTATFNDFVLKGFSPMTPLWQRYCLTVVHYSV